MATMRKRVASDGSTRWHVQVRLRGLPQQTASFEKLADARAWAQQVEGDLRKGSASFPLTVDRTVLEAIQRYRRDIFPLKPKAVRMQDQQLNWWQTFMGSRLLREVTPALLSEAREALARRRTPGGRPVTPATVNRYLAAISHVFTIACNDWEWLAQNPMARVKRRKEPRGRVRYLSDTEREQLLTACAESGNRALSVVVLVALATGMRYGEIMGLRWNDVDFVRSRVVLQETKNGERRRVPLPRPALETLLEHSERAEKLGKHLVFPGENPSRPADIRSAWRAAVARAGLEDFHFHDLRHSAASYLAMSGATLAEISEVLGHRTLSMVKRYAHLSEAHTAGVMERMADTFLGKSPVDAGMPTAEREAPVTEGKPSIRTPVKAIRRPGSRDGGSRLEETKAVAQSSVPREKTVGGPATAPGRSSAPARKPVSTPSLGSTPVRVAQKAPAGSGGPAKGARRVDPEPAERGSVEPAAPQTGRRVPRASNPDAQAPAKGAPRKPSSPRTSRARR